MFETVTESKQREGIQGFLSNHFGPVVDADLAREGMRDVSLVLLGLSCLLGAIGWYLVGPASLIVAFVFAVPAVLLRMTPSRLAASLLLFLTVVNAVLARPRLFPWIFVLFALRGVQLAFGYHRLLKAGAAPSAQAEGSEARPSS